MPKPASGKASEMIRSAGTPMRSISSEASNSISSLSGIDWNSSMPTIIMPTAAQMAY